LSLATEQLDGLRGVLEWEVLLVINCSRAAGWFVGSAGMGGFVSYQLQQSGWMVCGECWNGRFF